MGDDVCGERPMVDMKKDCGTGAWTPWGVLCAIGGEGVGWWLVLTV
jgi:hypothetical protein